jgi:hypothetical protein
MAFKTYDFGSVNKVIVHGMAKRFESFTHEIYLNLNQADEKLPPKNTWNFREEYLHIRSRVSKSFEKTLIVVCGASITRRRSKEYLMKRLIPLNDALKSFGSSLVFIRGCCDDPSIFENGEYDLTNVKFVQDYSVLKASHMNILCIGGSISFNRSWVQNTDKARGTHIYDKDEAPTLDEDKLDEILASTRIALVASSSMPSFAKPSPSAIAHTKWGKDDKELYDDIKAERAIMDKVYGKINQRQNPPLIWAYGCSSYNSERHFGETIFISLGLDNFYNVNKAIMNVFKFDIAKGIPSDFIPIAEQGMDEYPI